MPVDEYGNATDIPFEVDAPGCAIDGTTGYFNPLAVEERRQACGVCGTWGYSLTLRCLASSGIQRDRLRPDSRVHYRLLCFSLLQCRKRGGGRSTDSRVSSLRMYVAATYDFTGATDNGDTGICSLGTNLKMDSVQTSFLCVRVISNLFSGVSQSTDCGGPSVWYCAAVPYQIAT